MDQAPHLESRSGRLIYVGALRISFASNFRPLDGPIAVATRWRLTARRGRQRRWEHCNRGPDILQIDAWRRRMKLLAVRVSGVEGRGRFRCGFETIRADFETLFRAPLYDTDRRYVYGMTQMRRNGYDCLSESTADHRGSNAPPLTKHLDKHRSNIGSSCRE